MLTFHLPCLTLCAFYGKVQGLDTIPVVYVVESVHEVVTLLELRRGQEEVELERTILTDVAQDDTRFFIHDAWHIDLLQTSQGC